MKLLVWIRWISPLSEFILTDCRTKNWWIRNPDSTRSKQVASGIQRVRIGWVRNSTPWNWWKDAELWLKFWRDAYFSRKGSVLNILKQNTDIFGSQLSSKILTDVKMLISPNFLSGRTTIKKKWFSELLNEVIGGRIQSIPSLRADSRAKFKWIVKEVATLNGDEDKKCETGRCNLQLPKWKEKRLTSEHSVSSWKKIPIRFIQKKNESSSSIVFNCFRCPLKRIQESQVLSQRGKTGIYSVSSKTVIKDRSSDY